MSPCNYPGACSFPVQTFRGRGDLPRGRIFRPRTRHHFDHVDRPGAGGDGQQAAFTGVSQSRRSGPAQVERSGQRQASQRSSRLGLKQLEHRITVPRANQVIDMVNRSSFNSRIDPRRPAWATRIAMPSDCDATGIMIQSESGE